MCKTSQTVDSVDCAVRFGSCNASWTLFGHLAGQRGRLSLWSWEPGRFLEKIEGHPLLPEEPPQSSCVPACVKLHNITYRLYGSVWQKDNSVSVKC